MVLTRRTPRILFPLRNNNSVCRHLWLYLRLVVVFLLSLCSNCCVWKYVIELFAHIQVPLACNDSLRVWNGIDPTWDSIRRVHSAMYKSDRHGSWCLLTQGDRYLVLVQPINSFIWFLLSIFLGDFNYKTLFRCDGSVNKLILCAEKMFYNCNPIVGFPRYVITRTIGLR